MKVDEKKIYIKITIESAETDRRTRFYETISNKNIYLLIGTKSFSRVEYHPIESLNSRRMEAIFDYSPITWSSKRH